MWKSGIAGFVIRNSSQWEDQTLTEIIPTADCRAFNGIYVMHAYLADHSRYAKTYLNMKERIRTK